MDKFCRQCGLSFQPITWNQYLCSPECTILYNAQIRALVKTPKEKCVICGYSFEPCLEWHHVNPSQKCFSICEGWAHTPVEIKEELEKCIVLCLNCHYEIHAEKIDTIKKLQVICGNR